MNDESPLDLDLLDPDDPPDLVRPAVRRFRWRVVLFTVGCVLLAAGLAGWGVKAYIHHEHRFTIEDAMSPAQIALLMDARADCGHPPFGFETWRSRFSIRRRCPGAGLPCTSWSTARSWQSSGINQTGTLLEA